MTIYSIPDVNRVTRKVGKPIILPTTYRKGAALREALQTNANQIMLTISALVPPNYRGVYQSSGEAE